MSPVTGSSAALPYSPPAAGSFSAKPSVVPSLASPAVDAPSVAASSTVTLSDQARSALNLSQSAPVPAPTGGAAAGPSTYEAMKTGVVNAVDDIENMASDGVHAVVNGVETLVSSANTFVRGVLDSPFVAVSKICDAAGAVIDEI
jgi:hypothetical protein